MTVLRVSALLVGLSCIIAVDVLAGPPTLRFSAGTSIWGNTVGAECHFPLGNRFAIGFTCSRGYFSLVQGQWGDFLLPHDVSGRQHRVTLDLKQLLDLTLYCGRAARGGTRFLDEFGLGLTHVFLTFHDEYIRDPFKGPFRGQRDYSQYGLTMSATLIRAELHPPNALVFSLGIRGKLVVMDSPQRLTYENAAGFVDQRELDSERGHHFCFVYPEIYGMFSVRLWQNRDSI
jgi:hypothetical protein